MESGFEDQNDPAPAAGLAWAWLPLTLSLGLFVGVEALFRKRSGFGITWPAGPRGFLLLVAFSLLILFAFAISMGLAVFGMSGWVMVIALTVGVVSSLIVVAYDHTYSAEVRLAR